MKEFVCIVCPKGCRLRVDEENGFAVSGNSCERGESYGREEASFPTRMICSTVSVENGFYRRCPVKTSQPIPKDKIFEAMKLLDGVRLRAPIETGQVIVENICGTSAAFVASRDMREV